MKRQILIVSILLVAVQLFGQETRFWVGGSGKWADNSHWSTVSGGEPGASVPESGTSVVFDANSFSGDKNTVTLKDAVVIGSLTATDAEFVFSGKKSLTVEGSVSVDSKADFGKLRGALVLSAAGDQTLELPTKLEGNIIIEGGNWNLASDLATDGDIIINAGSLNSNNYGISCNNFTTLKQCVFVGSGCVNHVGYCATRCGSDATRCGSDGSRLRAATTACGVEGHRHSLDFGCGEGDVFVAAVHVN